MLVVDDVFLPRSLSETTAVVELLVADDGVLPHSLIDIYFDVLFECTWFKSLICRMQAGPVCAKLQ